VGDADVVADVKCFGTVEEVRVGKVAGLRRLKVVELEVGVGLVVSVRMTPRMASEVRASLESRDAVRDRTRELACRG
jgi:hypothetical protein